ncbi:diacylglycerol kinase family protein [Cryobacterium sp. Y82]|uniref:diacylglycerol kinase family protein n=1 Tax=Cryobacterium sp. Y82 TaxID=2045017 RepID=UPI000CE44BB6|nr:diacylglycerol kinase family protein [Cryobacterium sp. Y82]
MKQEPRSRWLTPTAHTTAARLRPKPPGGNPGLVPVGWGNDFARQFGIPNDLAAVADLLLTGSVRSVDVIDVRGRSWWAAFTPG